MRTAVNSERKEESHMEGQFDLNDEQLLVHMPILEISDDDAMMISAASSNFYTEGANRADTCCNCSQGTTPPT